jgi:tRNA 5-methylaminomethyl-2-thiouridine biosynthesis bifunctional protein
MDAAHARVALQVGFGLGQAFLHAWHDWRQDAGRATRLDFVALTPAPPTAEALCRAHRGGALQALAEELAAQWPPLTRNLHRLSFDNARVHLLLGVGEPLELLPQLRAQVHDMRIDEFALQSDPQRSALRLAKGLARLSAPMAQVRAVAALQTLRPALTSAGFQVQETTGAELCAVYQPGFKPRRRGTASGARGERRALIVGAGLAGCATAWALAELGWRSTVIDRANAPATQGSGNPAGLFHGIVNPQEGAHARFNRAAALLAQRTVQRAIDSGMVRGSVMGLLRLDTRGLDVQALRDELSALQLPGDYVQALDAAEAGARCGLPLQHPAWFYPGGGWVQPAALAVWFLQQAGSMATFRGGLQGQSLHADGGRWQLLDATGQVIAEAGTVVLANAADALRLMQACHSPVQSVRGQISLYRAASPDAAMNLPRLPLAGAGYLLPDIDGLALFGASSQPGNADADVRDADHAFNLQRLAQLSPASLPTSGLHTARLLGRVGWRCMADDRLPLVGAVPDGVAFLRRPGERLDEVPRRPGLYVFSALASRGISWAALGAQVLAAQISGAPVPLESSLANALDPARFAMRAARRAQPVG